MAETDAPDKSPEGKEAEIPDAEKALADAAIASGEGFMGGSAAQQGQYYKTLFRNSQLALINLAGARTATDPGAGPVSAANKRFYTHPAQATERSWKSTALKGTSTTGPWTSGYRMICPILSSTQYPPDVVVSSMVSKSKVVNEFFTFSLSSAQKALLVPKIRIFKVEYATKNGALAKPLRPRANSIEHPNPVEIIFDAYILQEQVDVLRENHGGRLSATGIEEFEWSLKGVNPGEVDNNIEASLKINFNNVSDIFLNNLRERTNMAGQQGRSSFLDLIVFPPAAKATVQGGKTEIRCPDREYDGSFFEIRVDVGWQVPPEHTGLFSSPQLDHIKDAQESLYLQLTDHTFDFKEDGAATLTANYRARSAMTDDRYDLLRYSEDDMGTGKGTIGDHQTNISDLRKELSKLNTDAEAGASKTDEQKLLEKEIDDADKLLGKSLEEKYKVLVRELITKHVYSCFVPYTLLLNERVDNPEGLDLSSTGDVDSGTGALNLAGSTYGGSIHGAQKFNTTVLNQLGSDVEGNTLAGKAAGPLRSAYAHAFKSIKIMGPHAMKGTNGSANQVINDKLLDPDNDDASRPNSEERGSADGTQGAEDSAEGVSAEVYGPLIQYLYFGDILEVFLTKTAVWNDISQLRRAFVVTDLEFINPRLIYKILKADPIMKKQSSKEVQQANNAAAFSAGFNEALGTSGATAAATVAAAAAAAAPAQDQEVATGTFTTPKLTGLPPNALSCGFRGLKPEARKKITSIVNVANIPINLELFLDFLKRQIIAKQRTTYYLEDFIRDIATEFVKPVFTQTGVVSAPTQSPVTYVTNGTSDNSLLLMAGSPVIGYTQNIPQFAAGTENILKDALTAVANQAALDDGVATKSKLGTVVSVLDKTIDNIIPTVEEVATTVDEVKTGWDTGGITGALGALVSSEVALTGKPLDAAFGAIAEEAAGTVDDNADADAAAKGAKENAADYFLSKRGYTGIATIDRYLHDYMVNVETPGAAKGGGRHHSFLRAPAPGAGSATEIKFISFQNYFGSYSGEYEENLEKGIPNFVVGLDRGIVKSVSFERVDQPYLREARTAKGRSASVQQLRELYNVTLTLYGNTLLKPGQLIYVEANRVVFGKPNAASSAARILGLGGYHLVVDVANTINKDGWETVIKALHVSMPYVR